MHFEGNPRYRRDVPTSIEREALHDVADRLTYWLERLPSGSRWRPAFTRARAALAKGLAPEDLRRRAVAERPVNFARQGRRHRGELH